MIFSVLLLLGPLWVAITGSRNERKFPEHSQEERGEAVIEVYGARVSPGWKGWFALHTWIGMKMPGEKEFTIYEIVVDKMKKKLPLMHISRGPAAKNWCGYPPTLLGRLQGKEAETLIPQLKKLVDHYPYQDCYRLWPGPNCNTFVAYLARHAPQLHLVLPPSAIGKDYLVGHGYLARAPSGSGFQFSFLGTLGLLIAKDEGIEINWLGLDFGFNPQHFTLLWPGVNYIQLSY